MLSAGLCRIVTQRGLVTRTVCLVVVPCASAEDVVFPDLVPIAAFEALDCVTRHGTAV